MLSVVRRKLEMAARVRDFFRENPSTSAGSQKILARLEDRLSRADALKSQQRAGLLAVHAGAKRRRELRQIMQLKLLPHLIRVGEMAGLDVQGVAAQFRLPDQNRSNQDYLVATKAMLAVAVANKELLLAGGLSDTLLEDLDRMVVQFEEAIQTSNIGRSGHVGARADLDSVTREIMELVDWLDGLNRYRFSNDPEKLAAWKSARHIPGPFRTVPDTKPVTGGVEPPGGGVAPAA